MMLVNAKWTKYLGLGAVGILLGMAPVFSKTLPVDRLLSSGEHPDGIHRWSVTDGLFNPAIQRELGGTHGTYYLTYKRRPLLGRSTVQLRYALAGDQQDLSQYAAVSVMVKSNSEEPVQVRLGVQTTDGRLWMTDTSTSVGPSFTPVGAEWGSFQLTSGDVDALDVSAITEVVLRIDGDGQSIGWDSLRLHANTSRFEKIMALAPVEEGRTADSNSGLSTASVLGTQADETLPVIQEISVDGRSIVDGDFVSQTPVIRAVITDETDGSGIATWNIQIWETSDLSDNDEEEEDNAPEFTLIGILAATPSLSVTVEASPTEALEDGDYTIIVSARDHEGNGADTQRLQVTINDEFAVSQPVNGPNPFNPNEESTQIEYQLAEDAAVNLYIYSLQGNRMASWEFTQGESGGEQGYNKVVWDGKDQTGEIVPNGIYVGYVIASHNDTKITKKVKIAVLR